MAYLYYPLFPIFAFAGFVVGLIPFAWHLQAWNAATCAYMIWSSVASLIVFINAVVWNGSIANPVPVWCDISTKFIIGAGVGIPAASLCINRRLFKIASVQATSVSREEKKKALLVDILISAGLPVLVMALHYIVQGHRYNIVEDIGCIPTIFNTPPAYPLVYMWPLLLGCISFIYASLTLHAFWKRRVQFNQLLSKTSSMTMNRYFRLMLLSCMEMMLTIPLTSYSIYLNTHGLTVSPWISWADAHYNFSFVEIAPAVVWTNNRQYAIAAEMGRWIYPCSAFLFFSLFGFAEEARRHYRAAFQWVKASFGFTARIRSPVVRLRNASTPSKNAPLGALGSECSLPAYSKKLPKCDVSIFSSVSTFADIDLEKGSHSPSGSEPTLASPSPTVLASQPEIRIWSFHEDALDSSDSQSVLCHKRTSTPPYHRPFSPPTVMPVTPVTADLPTPRSADAFCVVIHKESREEL